MTATAAQIAKVRRMTAELTTTTYADEDIQGYIELYKLMDENGENPRVPSTLQPGVLFDNPDWTPTYDLNSAAADIWEEKAAVLAQDFDFSADGSSLHRSQAYDQAMKQARSFRSRRSVRTVRMVPDILRDRTFETLNTQLPTDGGDG